jgi:hypothetical protein
MRYEILATEVLDHKTGLIWQRDIAENLTFDQAFEYAERISRETGLAWRVPTFGELRTLLDRSRHNPASAFPDMPSDWFWSSTSLDMIAAGCDPEEAACLASSAGFDSKTSVKILREFLLTRKP